MGCLLVRFDFDVRLALGGPGLPGRAMNRRVLVAGKSDCTMHWNASVALVEKRELLVVDSLVLELLCGIANGQSVLRMHA